MNNFKKTLLVSALLALSGASAAATVALEDCGRTAETFAFITDASGSMMQTIGEMKDLAAKKTTHLRNRRVRTSLMT